MKYNKTQGHQPTTLVVDEHRYAIAILMLVYPVASHSYALGGVYSTIGGIIAMIFFSILIIGIVASVIACVKRNDIGKLGFKVGKFFLFALLSFGVALMGSFTISLIIFDF